MSCQLGNTYVQDYDLKYLYCYYTTSLTYTGGISLQIPAANQILTLKSGVNAWKNTKGDINQLVLNPNRENEFLEKWTGIITKDYLSSMTTWTVENLMDSWTLASGSNLYSYDFGISPISISSSGLPSGLALFSFNTITGIPTQTGNYICNLNYTYEYCNQTTGVTKQIFINICTGVEPEEISYGKIFSKNLGPKFSYDDSIEYSTNSQCLSGFPFLSIPSGQRLVLESGKDAWLYTQYNTDYSFTTGNRTFTLSTGTNLFNTSNGIEPDLVSGELPAGLQFKNFCTITGIPNETGKWNCFFRYGYCTGSANGGGVFGKLNNLSIEVLAPSEVKYIEGLLYVAFSSSGTIPAYSVKVKNVDFYYNQNNRFTKYFENITGYGDNIIQNNNSGVVFGKIDRPTGFLPAMTYQTGILSGTIVGDTSSYSWTDVLITGTGSLGNVYIDNIIGQKQAINIVKFNTELLEDFDNLNINGIDFFYTSGTDNLDFYTFNSLTGLMNLLNSGATGLDFNLREFVGITGYLNGSDMFLYSYKLSGEDGNSIKITRTTSNIDSIKISHRYFQSGETLREPTNTWTGIFSTLYNNITQEKSGFYTYNYVDDSYFGKITGTVWVDTFSGNYYITTGILDITNPLAFSGSLVPFISNIYSGNTIIPSGQNSVASGFSISIRKPNYYDISGNIAKYIISGENFLYTGLIEG